jgi:hypothetical protein
MFDRYLIPQSNFFTNLDVVNLMLTSRSVEAIHELPLPQMSEIASTKSSLNSAIPYFTSLGWNLAILPFFTATTTS